MSNGLVCDTDNSRDNAQNSKDQTMTKAAERRDPPASELISNRIAELGDWRGETLSRMRQLIHAADPQVVE